MEILYGIPTVVFADWGYKFPNYRSSQAQRPVRAAQDSSLQSQPEASWTSEQQGSTAEERAQEQLAAGFRASRLRPLAFQYFQYLRQRQICTRQLMSWGYPDQEEQQGSPWLPEVPQQLSVAHAPAWRSARPPPCTRPTRSSLPAGKPTCQALTYVQPAPHSVSMLSQFVLHMPQVEFAMRTAESTAKVRNLGRSWGICSKHRNTHSSPLAAQDWTQTFPGVK